MLKAHKNAFMKDWKYSIPLKTACKPWRQDGRTKSHSKLLLPGLPGQEAKLLTEVGRKLQSSQPQSFTICSYLPQTVQSHPRSSEKKAEIPAAAEKEIALELSLHASLISMIKHIKHLL